ncbi:hypothetical protein ILUMI_10544 [Ignelater luminosus]|uniref:Peptidase S1 domain-containing protein n=1 Tax=Ignelater luminosus TaxID=2038154 RepID=A0A8K0GDJ0_IGNLU|nr:hypothetical protein ILUMI_10544 [Ignelater luminosus]
MKVLILAVIALAAVSQAAIDPSKIKPVFQTVTPLIPAITPKVVGGQEADPHGVPFQVAVENNRGGFCGGSIIGKTLVLTAAHCVDSATWVDVTAGAHRIFENEPTQQKIRSSKIVVHKDWNTSNLANDIALVHLSSELNLDNTARIVDLNQDTSTSLVGVQAIVSGWGRYSDGSGALSQWLRYGVSNIMSKQDCQRFFGSIITDNHVCLDGSKGVGACNGDSGGPLSIAQNDNPLQVGLVSFGSGAGCEKGYPTVYTNVARYSDWIAQNSN